MLIEKCFVIVFVSILGLLHSCLAYRPTKSDSGPGHNKVVVCYIGTWAVYRPGRGAFNINNISPSLCTHLVYSFVGLNATTNTIRSIDPFFDLTDNYGKGSFKKMTQLKTQYPHLKVTLAVGGWNEGSHNYSTMAMSEKSRKSFISSVVDYLTKYNFDGFDIDWEFPTQRGGRKEDKENFVLLVKEMKTELSKHNLILTAALGAGYETIDSAYDIPQLSKYLDLIHLMCYDYHGSWDRKLGPNAPLNNEKLSYGYSLEYVLKLGAPSEKLVVGLPAYGHTFTLEDNVEPLMGAATKEAAFQGPFTRQDGFMGYNEICLEFKNNKSWEILWDDKSSTPYAFNGPKAIAYDDERSISEKVKLGMQHNVAGFMIWSIDTDDFQGDCDINRRSYEADSSEYTYPLLRAVHTTIEEYNKPDIHKVTTPSVIDIDDNTIPSPSLASKQSFLAISFLFTVYACIRSF